MITDRIRKRVVGLTDGELPAYVYDLADLESHAAAIRTALSDAGAPEIFYAAKANPDPALLITLTPYVHGIEVASGGELAHVRQVLPDTRIAFGGPGKADHEVALARELRIERIHVESPHELSRLADAARAAHSGVDVLLRVSLAGERQGVALAMSGPFGMDPEAMEACHDILRSAPRVRLRGIHAHLASGLDAQASLRQASEILTWGRAWLGKAGCMAPEFNLGGGMAVDYTDPRHRFDWTTYGREIAKMALPGEKLRIEPGRAITVYSGWYVTKVLDVKKAHGQWYAVLRGGTHHIRTPATKNHNQPFVVVPQGSAGPVMSGGPVTLVGQLCTPKDVFTRQGPVERIRTGDIVAFAMAGAYAWNISHHDFLMHPKPTFHYVGRQRPMPNSRRLQDRQVRQLRHISPGGCGPGCRHRLYRAGPAASERPQ